MSTEDDNSTIKELRDQLKIRDGELSKFRTDFEALKTQLGDVSAKATTLEREKLDELGKLKAEVEDYKAKNLELTGRVSVFGDIEVRLTETNKVLEGMFETKLAALPDDKRTEVRTLAFVAGNPVDSLNKLESTIKLFGISTPITQGGITNPGKQNPPGDDGKKTETVKIDPKTVSYGQGLRTLADMRGETVQKQV